ncbi:MAG: ABC transporter permease [Nitrososphaerota archaeon]
MATREASILFAIKRFKGFWSQFKKSKRGMLGLATIIFFSIIAMFAPIIAQNDPIRPMAEVGQWPRYGPSIGRKIALQLCYPTWYKYLPNIPKGEINVTEQFYNRIEYVFGRTFQYFGRLGSEQANDDTLRLTNRISKIYGIIATLPDGTVKKLSSQEYQILPTAPREIRIKDIYDDGTIFTVNYSTGKDVVENVKVVQDPTFFSQDSLKEWNVATVDNIQVSYNSEHGYDDGTGNFGCLLIEYKGAPTQKATANVSRSFSYLYWEPPRWVLAHFSYKLEGASNALITFSITRREKDGASYYKLKSYTVLPSSSYTHEIYDTSQPEVKANVGTEYVLDVIFPYPADFTYTMQITFIEPNQNAKLYMDNVHFFMYGNAYGLLGTDNDPDRPRDIFSTLVHGTRVSLIVGLLATIFSTLIGLFLGLISGYVGGIVDEIIMRFADLLLVLPTLPLFIVLIVAMSAVKIQMGLWNIIILLTLFGWMSFARSVRSMVVSLRERAFVEAAKAAGAGTMHIINRHILPNVFALVYITLATSVPGAIITEASLSWLGLGDPLIPSWGKILYDFQSSGIATTKGVGEYWYWVFPPCVAIAALATAFILMGYALDEILNPRLRERR